MNTNQNSKPDKDVSSSSTKKIKNISGRKWLITINNPEKHGFSRENVIEKSHSLKNIEYIAFSEEFAPSTNTQHYHLFLYRSTGLSLQTLRNLFPNCRYDRANGSSLDNRNYVFKEGKWALSKKEESNVKESHYEFGECPIESQGARTDLEYMYQLVKDGCTNAEILEKCPETAIKHIDKLNKLRHAYLIDKFRGQRRLDLQVHYVSGKTGTGKSRDILDEHGDENVYRITDYQHPFDSYQCEPVLVFEEFRSSLRLQDMLNYLDLYPVTLPARFAPKVGCFTTVYVVSNWTFEMQYAELQKDLEQVASYEAWIRRFNGVVKVYNDTGITTYPTIQDYLHRHFEPLPPEVKTPFDDSDNQDICEQETMPFEE